MVARPNEEARDTRHQQPDAESVLDQRHAGPSFRGVWGAPSRAPRRFPAEPTEMGADRHPGPTDGADGAGAVVASASASTARPRGSVPARNARATAPIARHARTASVRPWTIAPIPRTLASAETIQESPTNCQRGRCFRK